jgi:hypothetical protein
MLEGILGEWGREYIRSEQRPRGLRHEISSNPTRGMDECLRVIPTVCKVHSSQINSEWEHARGTNSSKEEEEEEEKETWSESENGGSPPSSVGLSLHWLISSLHMHWLESAVTSLWQQIYRLISMGVVEQPCLHWRCYGSVGSNRIERSSWVMTHKWLLRPSWPIRYYLSIRPGERGKPQKYSARIAGRPTLSRPKCLPDINLERRCFSVCREAMDWSGKK